VSNPIVEFDRDGWTVVPRPGGLMQIRGRSPEGSRHALFDIVRIEEPREADKPTVAINADGQRYDLIKEQG
jgi:hypothetical protein